MKFDRTNIAYLTTLLLTGLIGFSCVAQAVEAEQADQPAAQDDAVERLVQAMNEDENGLTINREQGFVDVSGKVCLRQADFLEMLACTPDSREHESLVVLDAMPSTIHTALLLLELEPGAPATWEQQGDGLDFKMNPPRGPEVLVLIRYEDEETGETVEVPANEWVLNQKTSKTMEGATWVFAGSKIVDYEGRQIYVADSYGTALSLVNFGDDLLARQVNMTADNANHDMVWGANTEVIPAVGTKVVVRLDTRSASNNEQDKDGAEQAE
ncbi:MAG: YdjY domain-containing protein [Planctomycetota bacterium]